MNWQDFSLRGAARWFAGGGLLIAAASIFLGETLLAPTYEILHSGGVSAVFCGKSQQEDTCNFVYEMEVGNTGKKTQERIRIEWPLNMQHWGMWTDVGDIIATARKTPRPQIQPAYESGRTVYTINGLAPNTVVSIRAQCYGCARAQLQLIRQTPLIIEARGTITEADPKISALLHALLNVFRVVGLFG